MCRLQKGDTDRQRVDGVGAGDDRRTLAMDRPLEPIQGDVVCVSAVSYGDFVFAAAIAQQ